MAINGNYLLQKKLGDSTSRPAGKSSDASLKKRLLQSKQPNPAVSNPVNGFGAYENKQIANLNPLNGFGDYENKQIAKLDPVNGFGDYENKQIKKIDPINQTYGASIKKNLNGTLQNRMTAGPVNTAMTPAATPAVAPAATPAVSPVATHAVAPVATPTATSVAQPTAATATPNFQGMYDTSLANQKAAIQAGVDAGKLDLQNTISNAGKEYDPLRNEAYVNDQAAQRQLQERMANMGMSATGGKSMTLDSQRNMSLQNRLGDISRQQQQVVDDANLQINKLVAEGRVQEAQAVADEANKLNDRLTEDYYKTKEYNMQQSQIDYGKQRDAIGDTRYADETAYGRQRDTMADKTQQEQFAYQKERDTAEDTWQREQFNYQKGRDTTEDEWRQAQADYQKSRDTIGDAQWEKNFGMQEGQFEYQKLRDAVTDEQWKKNFSSQEKSEAFNKAWTMYSSGRLTAAQFKKMTGIEPKKVSSSRKSKKKSSGKTGDDYAGANPYTQNESNQEKAALVTIGY